MARGTPLSTSGEGVGVGDGVEAGCVARCSAAGEVGAWPRWRSAAPTDRTATPATIRLTRTTTNVPKPRRGCETAFTVGAGCCGARPWVRVHGSDHPGPGLAFRRYRCTT